MFRLPAREKNLRLETRVAGDVLEFAVADKGIGIPQEKQHLLFEQFSQVDSSFTRQFRGSGLELAVRRGLIQLMGGEV